MKGKLIVGRVTIAALVLAAWTAQAEAAAGTGYTTDSIGATPYVKVALFRRDGTGVAGNMMTVTDDSLSVQAYTGLTVVRVEDVSHVTVMPDKHAGRYGLFGIMAGVWAGNLAAYRANGHPTAFYASDEDDNEWGEILAAVFFGGIGGSLFTLGGKASDRDVTIVFPDNEQRRRVALRRLRRLTQPGSPQGPRVHVKVTAAMVRSRVSKPFEDGIKQIGFYPTEHSDLAGPEAEKATDLNLLRRLEVSVAWKPTFEIGLATVWMGEPSVWAGSVFSTQTEPWLLAQTYEAVGCFATLCHAKGWGNRPDEGARWFVGGGLGVVHVDYQLTAELIDYQAGNPTFTRRLSRTPPAAYVFSGVDIQLTRAHSFGIGADYVVAPSYHVSGVADAAIPDQKVKVGNGSIGLSLGLHF